MKFEHTLSGYLDRNYCSVLLQLNRENRKLVTFQTRFSHAKHLSVTRFFPVSNIPVLNKMKAKLKS